MKISIITATYNSAATLRDTMESVLSQTYQDWEHIIVDGASTDGTMDIVRSYAPRYGEGRLRYISEPDSGIYDAMNKGLNMATGDVVGILNSDDFYTTANVLSRIARELEASKADAVYGDVHYVRPDAPEECVRYYSSRNFRRWMMRLGFMPAHPSFYCRHDTCSRIGEYDTQFAVAADFEYLLRAIYVMGIDTRYVPMDCVTMRMGGASSSGLESHRRIFADHLIAYRKHGLHGGIVLDPLRYIVRVFDLLSDRLKKHHGSFI
ncbi:MAG: glycosyltransferase [Muribaculaceae bacterium]|nr:glycosyltransferase [Muribaculaceae bacterium]